MRIPALALALTMSLPAFAGAPLTVHMGDHTLDGSFLQPYDNAWLYTVKLPDGQVRTQGIWSDHVQWTTVDGRKRMLRVQGTSFVTGASNVMLNVFDPATLAPVTSESHNIDGTIFRRTFEGAHVASVDLANAKDSKEPRQSTLPEPVYDFNGGMFGLLMAALPLTEGLKGTIPAIADHEPSLSTEPFEVLREEEVAAGSRGKVRAWVVDSAKPGKYTMRFWVTKAPPYIIRLVMTDEEHQRVLMWDMI